MPDYIKTASFQAPTDYNVEAAEIARRKMLAQALQDQGNSPLGPTETVGGWAIPRSPMEGLGKVAQVLSGKYQENLAKQDEKKLAEQADAERKQLFANLGAIGQGVPNLAADPTKLANLNTGMQTDAVPGIAAPQVQPTSPQQRNLLVAQMLAQSKLPDMREMGNKLLIEALTKENNPANALFQKVDPKDFTQDSVKQFMASGDYSVLKPRVKMEAANLGGVTRLYDPYSTTGDLTHTATPDTLAKIDNTNFWNRNLTANQQLQGRIDLGRLGNQNIETNFNTGSSAGLPQLPPNFQVPPAGQPPAIPQVGATPPAAPPAAPAPRVPRPVVPAAPVIANDGLTPKSRQDIAVASAKQRNELENKRDFNMNGLGTTIDEARRILSGKGADGVTAAPLPTSSGIGAATDWLASQAGYAPPGAAQADQLKAIGGRLTAQMPRMEGPQSDKDVLLYREMAGQVGDNTLPLSRRLAALQQVETLWRKYDKSGSGYAGPRTNVIAPQGSSSNLFDQADAILGGRR